MSKSINFGLPSGVAGLPRLSFSVLEWRRPTHRHNCCACISVRRRDNPLGRQNPAGRFSGARSSLVITADLMLELIWDVFTWLESTCAVPADCSAEPSVVAVGESSSNRGAGHSIRWRRKGFRLYCRFLFRRTCIGWPITGHEVQSPLHSMANENPTWGAPRIHGELLKLGSRFPSEPSRDAFRGCIAVTGLLHVANVSEESSGGIAGMDFFTAITANFPDFVALVPDSPRSPRDYPLKVTHHPS